MRLSGRETTVPNPSSPLAKSAGEQKVLEVREEEDCVPIIAKMLRGQRIIRVDGHSGVGKSRIAKCFAKTFGWTRIEGDEFFIDPRPGGAFHQQINKNAFAAAPRQGLDRAPGVVLDAICLDYILPPLELGPEFRVYMLSIVDSAFTSGEERRRKKLGTAVYHDDIDPKGKADLVVWKRAKL
jgi:hypothetical protein